MQAVTARSTLCRVRRQAALVSPGHSRLISSWSSSESTSTPSSSFIDVLASTPPPNSFIDDFATTTSITSEIAAHIPSFWEPFSAAILNAPPHLALSYAMALPIFTLLLRASTTLPITMWQRGRTRRFEMTVMPKIREAQIIAESELRSQCRRAGKSFDEYKAAYKKRAAADAKRISKSFGALPAVTLLLPPLLNLPIFICSTLIIRDACQRSLSSLPLLPSLDSSPLLPSSGSLLSSTLDLPAGPLNPYSDLALTHLHNLAATPILWCESMILPDPTLGLPLLVGLIAMLNVEVSSRNRRAIATAVKRNQRVLDGGGMRLDKRGKVQVKPLGQVLRSRGLEVASEKKLSTVERVKMRRGLGKVVVAPVLTTKASAEERKVPREEKVVLEMEEEVEVEETGTSKGVTRALLVTSVLFIPVAAFAPAAVCVYWFSSNLFTLGQNLVLGRLDRIRTESRGARIE